MDLTDDQVEKMKQSVETKENPFSTATPVFTTPTFTPPQNLSQFEPSFESLKNSESSPF